MKRSFIFFLFFCFMLYSCKKEETPQQETVTSQKITPAQDLTSTEAITVDLLEEPTPTEEKLTAETTCVLCGRITKCTALIDQVWNSDLKMEVDKAYYLCDNCYPQIKESVETYEKESDDYISLLWALEIYFRKADDVEFEIERQFTKVIYGVGVEYVDRHVTFDSTGVHFDIEDDYALEKMKFALVPSLGPMYFSNMKTNGNTYEIRISYDGESYFIMDVKKPKNPLEKLN